MAGGCTSCHPAIAGQKGRSYGHLVHATEGKPDAAMEEIQAWGFHWISNHVAMKGAARGMLEFFWANKNTVYSKNHEIDPSGKYGIGHEFHLFKFEDYIVRGQPYRACETDLREKVLSD